MSDLVQPGVRVDAGVWQRFREDIERRKGHVRGHLRSELETAIQQYIDTRTDPELTRIEEKVDRLAAAVEADLSDVPTSDEPGTNTHTPTVTERPAANAATDKKVAYLAQYIREEYGRQGEIEELPRSVIVEAVKDEYSFRADTAKRYVERLVEYFDMVEHPIADGMFVTPDRREEILEQRRERIREETEVTA